MYCVARGLRRGREGCRGAMEGRSVLRNQKLQGGTVTDVAKEALGFCSVPRIPTRLHPPRLHTSPSETPQTLPPTRRTAAYSSPPRPPTPAQEEPSAPCPSEASARTAPTDLQVRTTRSASGQNGLSQRSRDVRTGSSSSSLFVSSPASSGTRLMLQTRLRKPIWLSVREQLWWR